VAGEREEGSHRTGMGGAAPHAMHCSARGWLEFTALNYVRLCFFRGCCQAARDEKKTPQITFLHCLFFSFVTTVVNFLSFYNNLVEQELQTCSLYFNE
jgi:hypothetical protein